MIDLLRERENSEQVHRFSRRSFVGQGFVTKNNENEPKVEKNSGTKSVVSGSDERGLRGVKTTGFLRFYYSNIGRWISRDPIKEMCGLLFTHMDFGFEDNLYGAFHNRPEKFIDFLGLENSCCGADVTTPLLHTLSNIDKVWNTWNDIERCESCMELFNPLPIKGSFSFAVSGNMRAGSAWDIRPLAWLGENGGWHFNSGKQGGGSCYKTVSFAGKCYPASAVNYSQWGKLNSLCNRHANAMLNNNFLMISNPSLIAVYDTMALLTTLNGAKFVTEYWKNHKYKNLSPPDRLIPESQAFVEFGYTGQLPYFSSPSSSNCKINPDNKCTDTGLIWRWNPLHP